MKVGVDILTANILKDRRGNTNGKMDYSLYRHELNWDFECDALSMFPNILLSYEPGGDVRRYELYQNTSEELKKVNIYRLFEFRDKIRVIECSV